MNLFNRKPKNTVKPGSYLEKRDKLVASISHYEKCQYEVFVEAQGFDPVMKTRVGYYDTLIDALKQDLLILDTKHELGLI